MLNLAARYHVDPAHTEHVARLALGALRRARRGRAAPCATARERELLWAGCILHDIGMSVDYDDHHKHSRYLILNAGLPGFEPREVALIAQAARYHRKGTPRVRRARIRSRKTATPARLDRMRAAAAPRRGPRAQRATRACARRTSTADDATIRLELEADGAAAVERWAAQREVDLFERAFGRRLEVQSA